MSVDVVVPGDRLLVGTGEVIPVDGRLLSSAVLDESALTGESLPVERVPGDAVRSGVVNAAGPVEMLATAAAAESTYSPPFTGIAKDPRGRPQGWSVRPSHHSLGAEHLGGR